MHIHHLRNATFIIESANNHILIDPMLSNKGALPAFARFRHQPRRNPTINLPENTDQLLAKVTHCLITHSQTFGIKALQHTDHLDIPGETFLQSKSTPVVCRYQDSTYLQKNGINVELPLQYHKPEPFLEGNITAVPARHGHGWIHHLMANGAGFFLQLPEEPSIFISGDTVLTQEIKNALITLEPDIAVVAAGSASLDIGGPILMTMKEIIEFIKLAPGQVIANHLEALNHCPTSRSQLRQTLMDKGLLSKVTIPEDGETHIFHR